MKPVPQNVSLKPIFADNRYFALKVSLDEVKPLVWRRFFVPATITLDLLHDVLQVVMGWEDYHLHEFLISERRYTEDPEEPEEGEDEWGVVLGHLISKAKTKFHYAYDFGDGWQHTITVEKIGNIPDKHKIEISCTDGKRACPPEDVGAPSGYAHYLKALPPTGRRIRRFRRILSPSQRTFAMLHAIPSQGFAADLKAVNEDAIVVLHRFKDGILLVMVYDDEMPAFTTKPIEPAASLDDVQGKDAVTSATGYVFHNAEPDAAGTFDFEGLRYALPVWML
jgi:hypothetical protein